MTLKTSLLITGDASTAVKAVEDLRRGVESLGVAGKSAAGGVATVAGAENAAAIAARGMEAATGTATAAVRDLATESKQAQAAVAGLGAASAGAAGAAEGSARKLRQHTDAVNDNEQAARRNAFGLRNLGQQFGDMGVMVGGGIDPLRAFATQAGQMGYALSEMTGKAGAVGTFLTGPWGITLTVGVSLLAPFISKLWEGGDASGSLEGKSASLADAFQKQAFGTDTARKALQEYNREAAGAIEKDTLATGQAIRLAEARLKETGATIAATKALIEKAKAEANKPSAEAGQGAALSGSLIVAAGAEGDLKRLSGIAKEAEAALANLYTTRAKDNAKAATDQTYALNRAYDRQRDAAIRAAQGSVARAKALDGELTAIERQRKTALDAQKGTAGGTGNGDAAAAAKLASATNGVERAQAQLTIARREANAALKAHSITEAEATARITAAENALNAAQAAAKAHAGAVRDVARATREADAENRKLDTAADAMRVRFGEVDAAAGRYKKTLAEIANLTSKGKLTPTEGGLFVGRALLEEKKRTDPESFKTSFDQASIAKDIKAIEDHAAAETEAAAVVRHAASNFSGAVSTVAGAVSQAFGSKAGAFVSGAGKLADGFLNPEAAQQKSDKLAESIKLISKGIGISETAAGTIGKFAGKGIEGAAAGALANSVFSPIAKGLGLKTSQTGAQLGGAVGGALSGVSSIASALGPLGAALGPVLGIAGSLLGGLFKTSKNGGATIAADGSISTSGNSASRQAAAAGAAGSVVDGVKQIAQQLGGTIGKLSSITIGTYGKNDEYRVNTAGGTQLGGSSSKLANVEYFGSGEAGAAAALAYAIQLQVQRGAVEGLSAAVQKAIKSSSDLNAALQEAVKVQDVELIAKGLSGQFQKAFKDLEATAKERVRIANEYNLDVLAVEKQNAKDRAALVDQMTKQQAGSLQSLVADLTSGDLFEGSYKDKIAAIGGRIDKAKADMEAGVVGAVDTYADLLRQKLAAEKDAYGSTAIYAASRNSTIAEAQAAIAKVNAQITAAKSDPALAETNAALDENNSQNAELIAAVAAQGATLKLIADKIGSGRAGNYFDLETLARV